MTRISKFCVVSSTLAALALSATAASAENLTVRPVAPKVSVPSHRNDIQNMSWQWGASQTTDSTGSRGSDREGQAPSGSQIQVGSKAKQYRPADHPEWK